MPRALRSRRAHRLAPLLTAQIDDLQSKLAERDAQLDDQTRNLKDKDAELVELRRRVTAHESQPVSFGAPPVSMPESLPSLSAPASLASPFVSYERGRSPDAGASLVRHGPVMHGFLFSAGPGQPFELYDPQQHAPAYASMAANAPIHAPACGVASQYGLTATPFYSHHAPAPHVEVDDSPIPPSPATLASPVHSPQLGNSELPFQADHLRHSAPASFGFGTPQGSPSYVPSGPTRFALPPVPEFQTDFDASRYLDIPEPTNGPSELSTRR